MPLNVPPTHDPGECQGAEGPAANAAQRELGDINLKAQR